MSSTTAVALFDSLAHPTPVGRLVRARYRCILFNPQGIRGACAHRRRGSEGHVAGAVGAARQARRHPGGHPFDGTGRLQTVSEADNPRFRRLIELFAERTGIPVLLNKSFNDNGEPIVESPQDAVRCFLGTDLDALVLEDVLLIKK